MPFNRPTLQQLYDRAAADLEAELPGTDARLRRSLLNVIARVLAGATHGLYGYLNWISRQAIINLSEAENLESWANVWGLVRKQAAPAIGNTLFTGTEATAIPLGTLVQRADGVQFITTLQSSIVGGSALVPISAIDGGFISNTSTNTKLNLVSTIAGIDATNIVDASGLNGGADIETDADLLARLLARIQKTPQGGAAIDYENWGLEVDSVTRVWVFPLQSGDGTVGVTFVMDNSVPIIPNAAKVQEVQDYIDARRPVTASVTVYAPAQQLLDLTIQLTPNTQAVRDAVSAEVADLLSRFGGPGETLYLSQINEAISSAIGETDHTLVVPVANIIVPATDIYSLGTITWV